MTRRLADREIDERRRLLSAALLFSPIVLTAPATTAAAQPIVVWTGPGCSCCHEWIKHLEANGFEVTTHDGGNGEARQRLGMPVQYGSCHTGQAGPYAIEGHVPAREIHRLLDEQPDAVGLSVPSMPLGSPGMDGPQYEGERDPYEVLLVHHDGTTSVYESYPGN